MSLLLAREPELERLHAALGGALAGAGGIVFVTGEAGSGKSALLAAFAAHARAAHQDLAVASGTCDAQTGTADPYLPFREILAELTGVAAAAPRSRPPEAGEATQLARWIAASGRALVEHAPDLVDIMVPGGAILTKLGTRAVQRLPWARRLAEITGGRAERGAAAQIDREHIFEQYTTLLRSIAREHPLVLLLDDLHWIDAGSAELLFHLARHLEHERILLVGAYRADDVALGRGSGRHPLEPILNELQRYRGEILLRLGESTEHGRAFVRALLEHECPGLDAEFGEELFRHTGGHPLFTLELLRHLQESGALHAGADGLWYRRGPIEWSALPARVEGIIGERAARLDERQREILTTAAVEGQEFCAEVVATVLAAEPRELVRVLSGELEKRHRLVVARGVERVNGARIAAYDFRHSLFHAWFYRTLDPVERAYLHESVGRAVERIYAADVDRVAGRLARHFTEAEQPVEAIRYTLLAADRARSVSANAEAAERYRFAAELLAHAAAELDPLLGLEYAARIEEGLGALAELAGDHLLALRHFDAALRTLEAADADDLPVLRARIARRSAKPLEHERRYAEAAERLDLAERLLGSAARDRPEGREEWLQIQLARIWVAYWLGETGVMQRVLDDAAPMIMAWGGPAEVAAYQYCRALLGMRLERYHLSEATLAAAAAACQASRRGGQLAELGVNEFGLGFAHLWRHELDDARRMLEQAADTARRAGDRVLESRAVLYLSLTARFRGDVDGALEWADRAEDVATLANLSEYLASVRAQRGWAALRRGDPGTARARCEEALQLWATLPYRYPLVFIARLPLVEVALREARFDEAAAHAAALVPPPMARLREPAWSALEHAAADPSPRNLEHVVTTSREVGYL